MNCHEARRHWNLYHDSEGDAALHFEINEHLAMCPACMEWFAGQSRLETLLIQKLAVEQATGPLWSDVLAKAGLRRRRPARRWILFSGLAACAALLAFGIWFGFFRSADSKDGTDLAQLSAEWHRRLAAGNEALQIQSESDLEVEAYLRQRVAFPVRCPPRKDAGFAVRGAGVCRLAEQPTAFLLGQVEDAPVSIFILPLESLSAFPSQRAAILREKPYRWREGRLELVMTTFDRNLILVAGELDPERLARVLSAYGTYPDHHSG